MNRQYARDRGVVHHCTVAKRVAEHRSEIVDGHLIMSSLHRRHDQTRRRYAIRADFISFLDGSEDRYG